MFSGERLKQSRRPELSAEDKQIVVELINTANKAAKTVNDYFGQLPLPEQVVSDIISEELDYDEDAA